MTSKRGFTLIEILIVVAIIGILASVVLVGLGPAQRRGRDTRRISDLRNIQTALELYHQKNGNYPAASGWVATLKADKDATTIPKDPSTGVDYTYLTDSTQSVYLLKAKLEDASNSTVDMDAQLPPDGITDGDCGKNKTYYCVTF